MNQGYERDLDLNLLRVFVVVAESGSVTAAASRLYLTQPAISAALRRLTTAVGAPLYARSGRGLVLTTRGQQLLDHTRPHLEALVQAARSPEAFDLRTSDRTIRLGLSDSSDRWLLQPLLRRLEVEAPRLRLIVLPVQFRTVGPALANASVDLAVTVADELPAGVRREAILLGGFVVLYDPRRLRLRRLTVPTYLEQDHVIVSYNGDLRGLVEDLLGLQRKVRVSVPSFQTIGGVVEGSRLLATVPELVAQDVLRRHPKLKTAPVPFRFDSTPLELLWRSAVDDDPAITWVRKVIGEIGAATQRRLSRPGRGPRGAGRSPRPGNTQGGPVG